MVLSLSKAVGFDKLNQLHRAFDRCDDVNLTLVGDSSPSNGTTNS